MRSFSIYKEVEVEVEVDLDDFSTEDLIEELQSRHSDYPDSRINDIVEKIYMNRREGKDYQVLLDELIYASIGKIV